MQSTINLDIYRRKSVVDEYDQPKNLFPGEREVFRRIRGKILGTPILDVGVGVGRTTSAILEISSDYLGIDFSEAMIAACRARFPDVRFLHHDARRMKSLGTNRYGFIWFSFNGIDCLSDEERQLVIHRAFRMLKPNGFFFFSSHNLAAHKERPWELGLYPWSWSASGVANSLRLMMRAMGNYVRYRHLQTEGRHHAVRTDSGHEFGCLHYYVQPEEQVRRLDEAGFVDIETMGWSGQPLSPSHQDVKTAAHVYYLARKPAFVAPEVDSPNALY